MKIVYPFLLELFSPALSIADDDLVETSVLQGILHEQTVLREYECKLNERNVSEAFRTFLNAANNLLSCTRRSALNASRQLTGALTDSSATVSAIHSAHI